MSSPIKNLAHRNSQAFGLKQGSGQMDAPYSNGTYQVKKMGSELVCEACWRTYLDSGTHQQKCGAYACLNRMMNKGKRIEYAVDPDVFRLLIDENKETGPTVPFAVLMHQADEWNLDEPIVVPESMKFAGEKPDFEGKTFVELMDGLKQGEHHTPSPMDIYATAANMCRDNHVGYKKRLISLGKTRDRDYSIVINEVMKGVANNIAGNNDGFVDAFVKTHVKNPDFTKKFVDAIVSDDNAAEGVATAMATPTIVKKLLSNPHYRKAIVEEMMESINLQKEVVEDPNLLQAVVHEIIKFGKNNPESPEISMLWDGFPNKRQRLERIKE